MRLRDSHCQIRVWAPRMQKMDRKPDELPQCSKHDMHRQGLGRTLAAGGGAASPEGAEAAVRAQAAEADADGRRPEGSAGQTGHGAAARLAHRVQALRVVAPGAAYRRVFDVLHRREGGQMEGKALIRPN